MPLNNHHIIYSARSAIIMMTVIINQKFYSRGRCQNRREIFFANCKKKKLARPIKRVFFVFTLTLWQTITFVWITQILFPFYFQKKKKWKKIRSAQFGSGTKPMTPSSPSISQPQDAFITAKRIAILNLIMFNKRRPHK